MRYVAERFLWAIVLIACVAIWLGYFWQTLQNDPSDQTPPLTPVERYLQTLDGDDLRQAKAYIEDAHVNHPQTPYTVEQLRHRVALGTVMRVDP